MTTGSDVAELWDEWSTIRLSDTLTRFQHASERHGYPAGRLQSLVHDVQLSTVNRIKENLQSNLKQALLKPGTKWQRLAVMVAGYLQLLLPLLVVFWIVYRALAGFIGGASDRTAYVGLDFLINGLILGGISWLVPWLLAYMLKPSIPRSVNRGLHKAVLLAVEQTSDDCAEVFDSIVAEREKLLERGIPLKKRIGQLCSRTSILKDTELKNLVLANGD